MKKTHPLSLQMFFHLIQSTDTGYALYVVTIGLRQLAAVRSRNVVAQNAQKKRVGKK